VSKDWLNEWLDLIGELSFGVQNNSGPKLPAWLFCLPFEARTTKRLRQVKVRVKGEKVLRYVLYWHVLVY